MSFPEMSLSAALAKADLEMARRKRRGEARNHYYRLGPKQQPATRGAAKQQPATHEERCRAQRRFHEAAAERGVLTGRTNAEVFMEKRKANARLGLLEASYRSDESKEVDPLRVAILESRIKEGLAAGLGFEDPEYPMIVLERMEASVSALTEAARRTPTWRRAARAEGEGPLAGSSLRAKAADLRHTDPFEVLGVASDASTSEIQAAYKKLSLKCDPDKTQHPCVDASAEFKLLKKAYDAIMGGRAVHTGQTAAWGKRSRQDESLQDESPPAAAPPPAPPPPVTAAAATALVSAMVVAAGPPPGPPSTAGRGDGSKPSYRSRCDVCYGELTFGVAGGWFHAQQFRDRCRKHYEELPDRQKERAFSGEGKRSFHQVTTSSDLGNEKQKYLVPPATRPLQDESPPAAAPPSEKWVNGVLVEVDGVRVAQPPRSTRETFPSLDRVSS